MAYGNVDHAHTAHLFGTFVETQMCLRRYLSGVSINLGSSVRAHRYAFGDFGVDQFQ